jgi:hypothetical protein
MAYTFFPKSVTEITKTLKPKTQAEKDKVSEIIKLFTYLTTNSQTKKLIDTPVNIDPKSLGQVNVSRKIKSNTMTDQKLKTLVTNTLKLSKIKVKFGDGSAGGRGVNNKGGKFETALAPAIKTLNDGGKVADKNLMTSYNEIYNLTDLGKFDQGSLFVDGTAGASNTKRPLQYSGSNIQLLSNSADFNIGKMVTDITLKGSVKKKKKEIYLSLKTTSTVTFFNVGIKEVLTTEEIKKNNITNKNGLKLLELFGIEPALFCDCFNHPRGFSGHSEEIKLTPAKATKLQTLLESGIGHGYVVVHQITKDKIKVFNVTKK